MPEEQREEMAPAYRIEVRPSGDYLEAHIRIACEIKPERGPTLEELTEALAAEKVAYGIDEDALRRLADLPAYNSDILIARGIPPVHGEDGVITYYVKKNSEYKPDFGGDSAGSVDFKNADFFQLVKAGAVLCEVKPPTRGTEGTNVYGSTVPAKDGAAAPKPDAENALWSEDELTLTATKDGVIDFRGNSLRVVELLTVNGDVDLSTGNIRFAGDVVVKGDVCDGFEVEVGGNLSVKGNIAQANVHVKGDLFVEGIFNGLENEVAVEGNLTCKHIESGKVIVRGDIKADYIMGSDVTCWGNGEIRGQKGAIIGGKFRILRNLEVNNVGNERGSKTMLKLLANPEGEVSLKAAKEQKAALKAQEAALQEKLSKVRTLQQAMPGVPQLDATYKQVSQELMALRLDIKKSEQDERHLQSTSDDYPGIISCNGIIYPGVDICAGHSSNKLNRDHGNIEHSRVYITKGEWTKAVL